METKLKSIFDQHLICHMHARIRADTNIEEEEEEEKEEEEEEIGKPTSDRLYSVR